MERNFDFDEQVNLFESIYEEEEECEHPKKLTRKYICIDVDFEDAEVVAKQLNDAIQQIQTIHHTMGINDKTIKVGVDPNKKQLNIMYYGFQD